MPSPTSIETERLRLRPVAVDDLDEIVRLHEDPEVSRFMGNLDREWLVEWVEGSDREWAELGYGRMVVLDRGGRAARAEPDARGRAAGVPVIVYSTLRGA